MLMVMITIMTISTMDDLAPKGLNVNACCA